MATESITQAELARRINRTARQVRKLTEEHGMPRNSDGTYPWPGAQEWWVKFKQEEKARRTGTGDGVSELDRARADKEWSLAALRQLDLEERQGNLITLDFHLEKMELVLGMIRKRLENLPSMAPRFVALDSPAQAQALLEKLRDETMDALRRMADELLTENDDAPDGDQGMAA